MPDCTTQLAAWVLSEQELAYAAGQLALAESNVTDRTGELTAAQARLQDAEAIRSGLVTEVAVRTTIRDQCREAYNQCVG